MKPEMTKERFVKVTKNLIKTHGIDSISVRKISAKAGFSAKSMYNHFDNIDGLLWQVRSNIIEEVSDYLDQNEPEVVNSTDDIKILFKNYLNFFVRNPEYYKFLFFHALDKTSKKTKNLTEDENYFASTVRSFNYLKQFYEFSDQQVMTCIQTIIHSCQGLLTSFISGNDDFEENELFKQFNDSVDFILRRD